MCRLRSMVDRFRLMQKLYWLFCVRNFTFLQNYDILHLLTIGHDYPVLIDKHANYWNFTSPWPLRWGQRSYLNFTITQSVANIFCWNFACRQRYNKYETIQTWFLIKGLCLSDPLGGLCGWGLNSTFSEHNHVAYQIKGNHKCSNMVAYVLPADPYPSWGWDQKVKIPTISSNWMRC